MHLAGQGDLGVVGVAQQLRLLPLQRQRALNQGRVVVLPGRRPRNERAVKLLAQRPAHQKLCQGISNSSRLSELYCDLRPVLAEQPYLMVRPSLVM